MKLHIEKIEIEGEHNRSNIVFRLAEYNSHIATVHSSDEIVFKIKVNNTTYQTKLDYYEGQSDICLWDSDDIFSTLKDALVAENEIPCVIEIDSFGVGSLSKYSFTLDGTGFANVYKQTYGY